ncbi:MAG TPA: hypothetical protein PKL92_03335 [Aquaticitalea sp.]|nr:hypothetical protein [Aquaticitalea sp.]HNU59401.1 hypothetical protein [Aquaticitalea sp.]
MKYSFIAILFIFILLSSCKKEQNPFLVSKNHVGLLTDSTKVMSLKTVFASDSIVRYKTDPVLKIPMNFIEIHEKKGALLLTLTPKNVDDSTSTITNIRIEDSRYKTAKGISKKSRFKDIQSAYSISKIDNLISTVVVSVNEINAQFAIDKTKLPANLRYDMNIKFEPSQIPDNARIKYFFINWY